MTDDFERMLARLDSNDEEIRKHALDDLERLFREQHPARAGGLPLPTARRTVRRGRRGAKEGHVPSLGEPSNSVDKEPPSLEEARVSEEQYDTGHQAAHQAIENAQPRVATSSREELGLLRGLWAGGPREFELDDDLGRTYLGEAGAPRRATPELQMRPERLAEIAIRYLGKLPDDLADHALEHYVDAIDAIGDLVSEVQRLQGTDAWDPRSFLGEVARPFLRRDETLRDATPPLAVAAGVRKKLLSVELLDGRTLVVPIAWFPRLAKATGKQLRNVVIEEDGLGLHWPELDEDLGVEPLLTHAPVTLPAPDKSRRSRRLLSISKKWRKRQRRRSLRDAEEFARAEVDNPDPIQARHIPAPASGMRDQRLSEIQKRHLGPLPDDLADRAVADYLDAVDDIRDLVSELERLRAMALSPHAIDHIHHLASEAERLRGAVGRQTTTDAGVIDPDEREPTDSGRSSTTSALRQRINSDPGIRSGQPTLRGMRITVKDVLGFLGAGMTYEVILAEYPYLEREDILAALEYAAETMPDKIPE